MDEENPHKNKLNEEYGETKNEMKLLQWPLKNMSNKTTARAIGDDKYIEKFYEPYVRNETDSNTTALETTDFYSDLRRISKELLPQKNKSPLLFEGFDFSSDDSVKDPDYKNLSVASSSDVAEDGDINMADIDHYDDQKENNINLGNNKAQRLPTASKKTRKNKRNLGKSYFTQTGKVVNERKCLPMRICRKNCQSRISFAEQKSLFDAYWGLGTYNARILYLSGLIEIGEKQSETRIKNAARKKDRNFSNRYYVDIEGSRINVCQDCFCTCFGETKGFLRSVIKKKKTAPDSQMLDKRGKATPKNKLPDSKIQDIKTHIQKFPAYESHYCRRDSGALYLCNDLNISKMYDLYCKEIEDPVSLTKYSEIFHSMNLKFKPPKLDTCSKCDIFKAKLNWTDKSSSDYATLKEQQALHHEEAELAYECKRIDKNLAKANENIKTYVFDLQQVLPTPFLRANTCYYKRQLSTFNLTIHDCETNESYCYMWHEAIANRGANEISSCIFEHLRSQHSNGKVDKIIFYSDSCSGQNKNSYVSCMFLTFLENNPEIKTIEHKFLVPGHTHMECDVDHATIERKKNSTTAKIHHPRDWYNLVSSAGKKNKFKIIEMDRQKFFDFGSFSQNKLFWRKVNESNEKYYWSNVKWLRYTQNKFGFIEYKTSLRESDAFHTLNVGKRGINTIAYSDIEIIKAVPTISKEKKADLISILDLIDPNFHSFYTSLKDGNVRNTDPDIISDQIKTETV